MDVVTNNPLPGNGEVNSEGSDAKLTMADSRLFHSIAPRNLLSFGPRSLPLKLGGLNILIGPNGSGKSNLLDVIALQRSTATDCRPIILQGGGIGEWIWKGTRYDPASIDAVISNPVSATPMRHVFEIQAANQSFQIADERLENEAPSPGQSDVDFYFRRNPGNSWPRILQGKAPRRSIEKLTNLDRDLSILAQRRDPDIYPEITFLAGAYDRIRLYREWNFGRTTVFRQPQKADSRNDRLEEDFSNLGLFLNRLRRHPKAKNAILAGLQDLYEGLTDFDVSVEGGTVQVFFTEDDFTIPATRLSDGSLRYLCLLAILCDPDPPPFIGIEEPELGLHPDLLPRLADRLVAATRRCQLIVTTHSDILVDALSDFPEAVVVCEKRAGQTVFDRLNAKELAPWLEKYRLGELWTRGQIGGKRW